MDLDKQLEDAAEKLTVLLSFIVDCEDCLFYEACFTKHNKTLCDIMQDVLPL